MSLTLTIQILLGILSIYFIYIFINDLIHHKNKIKDGNIFIAITIGFVVNFFDALGIGAYATTALSLKLTHFLKNDKLLPGTLNTSSVLPVIFEAFLFITSIKLGGTTLLSLIIAATIGAFLGSKIMTKFDEKRIQVVMGCALIITAILITLQNSGVIKGLGTGNATALTGWKLAAGIICNFILGILMTAGVGLYAPCMAMVYLLGLTPISAFPIMMASSAFLIPVASREFIRKDQYNRIATIGITLGGLVGILIAVNFVKNLSVKLLTWLVVIVIFYTAIMMLFQGIKRFNSSLS